MTLINYESLKALAAEIGCRVTDLIALSEDNDPFFAGRPSRAKAAEWFAECWERFGFRHGTHLRRTHYVLISQEQPVLKPSGEAYENTLNDWKFLGVASLAARYLKLVPAAAFVDRRNPEALIFAPEAASTFLNGVRVSGEQPLFAHRLRDDIYFPSLVVSGFHRDQDYLVEIWVEKSTQNDVLVPLARGLGCNLVTGVGEMSETAARLAVGRAVDAGKPMHVIYIADHDPGGRSMPVAVARKIQYIASDSELDLDITLQPLALTPEQVAHYRLPRIPLKETERRAAKFEARFGSGATELDALEALCPGELAKLVEARVCQYIDPTLRNRVYQASLDFNRQLDEIDARVLERHRAEVEDVQLRYDAVRDDLTDLESDAAEIFRAIGADLEAEKPSIEPDIPAPRPARPVEDPLFDSRRDYLAQIDAYRAWQGRGGES